jgi:hypothetical protein
VLAFTASDYHIKMQVYHIKMQVNDLNEICGHLDCNQSTFWRQGGKEVEREGGRGN